MSLSPEELVEKMAEESRRLHKTLTVVHYKEDAEAMLRIVLQALKDGEIVDTCDGCFAQLKEDFAKMLEVEK